MHEKSTMNALPEYKDSAKKPRSDLVDQRIRYGENPISTPRSA